MLNEVPSTQTAWYLISAKGNKYFPYLTAFITGLTGMALEIVAVRLVSPFLGSSTEVWSIIISVIMIALALGYFFGKYFKSAYLLTYFAGIFIIISYLFIISLSSLLGFTGSLVRVSPFARTFLISFFLFFLPVFLLGSVYPLLIKTTNQIFNRDTSGSIYAVSTIGSVVGTLFATFVLIPILGAKIAFLIIAIVLEIVTFLGFNRWQKILPIAVLILIFFTFPRQQLDSSSSVIFQTESVYQPIRVIKQGESFYLSLDNLGLDRGYSSVYTPGRYLTGAYYDSFLFLPYFLPKISPLNVLIVGLGGGTISRQYQHYFSTISKLEIDGIEIDSEVVATARKYFDLDQPGLTVHIQDGRIFLSESKTKYNLIFVDVYARQVYIPFYLATKEFIKLGQNHLNSGGLMAYNVSDSSQNKSRLKYISQTLVSVFPYVYSIYPGRGTEYLVVGANSQIDFSKDLSKILSPDFLSLYKNFRNYSIETITVTDQKYVLTDDNSPERI